MNKLVSLGLLALSFGVFSGSVLAGNVGVCEELKGGTPGLYGLCIAYGNATDEQSRVSIRKNYAKKWQPGDKTLEELFTESVPLGCTCWAGVDLMNANKVTVSGTELQLEPAQCNTGSGLESAQFVFVSETTEASPQTVTQGFAFFFGMCGYFLQIDGVDQPGSGFQFPADATLCLAELMTIQEEFWDTCPFPEEN